MQYSFSSQQPPPNPVAAFFRSTNLVFAIYDTRRGQCEGEEADKLLSFFPTIAPIHVRTSIVGLAQAVTSFAATLNQNDNRFKSMVAEHNKWVMFECEPAIWLLAIVRKSWAGGTCTNAAFKALLTSMYDVFVLLHGRMDTLLEQDPTGFALRRVLQPLLDEVGFRLLHPEAAASREAGGHVSLLANPLAPYCPGAVPLITTSRRTFLAVQSLVNQLLVASFYGSRLVAGVVVMWGGVAVWSTLAAQDTAALTTLAARALVPAAKAAQKSRPGAAGTSGAVASGGSASSGGGGGGGAATAAGPGETAYETLISPLQWRAGAGITAPSPPQAAAAALSSSAAAAALSPAVSSLAAMAAGLGLTSTAAAAATASGSAGGGAMFGPSTPAGISLAGILGFGIGAGVVPATTTATAAPPLPVSSSAAAGPSSSSSYSSAPSTGGAAAGGSGVGSALPPFLSSFLRPRLRPSLYSSAPGGALPLDTPLPMTHVWLRGSHEWAQLLPYHRGQLLVLALLHDGPPPGTEVLAALAAVLGRGAGPAAAALAAEVPARSVWHEKGHRYCFTDPLCHVTRYSPVKKVLTLSSSALRHLAHYRSKMDDWDSGGGDGPGGGDVEWRQHQQQQQEGGEEGARSTDVSSVTDRTTGAAAPSTAGAAAVASASGGGDSELVVRTGHDAWLVLRSAPGGRRLYAASEQGALADLARTQGVEPSLAAAVASTDALCDRLFPGVFLQP